MPQNFSGVMKEFKEGKLHSGSKVGKVVKSVKQAKAIAISENEKFKGKASNKQKHELAQGFQLRKV